MLHTECIQNEQTVMLPRLTQQGDLRSDLLGVTRGPLVTGGSGRLSLPSHILTKQSMQSYMNIRFSTDFDFLSFVIVVYSRSLFR